MPTNETLEINEIIGSKCSNNDKLLFYLSAHFCELFRAVPTLEEVRNALKNSNPIVCKKIRIKKRKIELVGFYIEPQADLNDGAINNCLYFRPVWLITENNNFAEIVSSDHFTISHNAINTNPPPNWDVSNPQIDIFAETIVQSNPSFNHKLFQFSDLHNPVIGQDVFEKAFISKYELFLLVQMSTYIGIAGAKISRGKFSANLTQSEETSVFEACSRDFFTYKFLAFDIVTEIELPRLPKKTIALRLSNFNKDGAYQSSVPGETWAVPCPPMWRPI